MIKRESGSTHAAKFYAAVSGEHLAKQSAPIRTAWLIERLASQRGWPAGELLGSENELREQLGVGRETLREAISILSNRGVVEVRRGRNGGIQVLSSDLTRTANAVAAYLRAIGVTPDQLERCVTGLHRLLASRLSRRTDPLPARRPDEPARRWLSRACDHPVYLLYLEVLDGLDAGGPDHGSLPDGLINAIAQRDAEAIVGVLGTVPHSRRRVGDDFPACSARARAFSIAQKIVERATAGGKSSLGNEISLCDEFAASRSVIRQALRILQDLDVVHARLGRSGGYEIRTPRPIGVIRQVYAWLEACRFCPFALIELVWDLNAANVRLAAANLSAMPETERERHFAALEEVLEEKDNAQRFVGLQKRLAEFAASPLIDIFARSVVSYQALYRREQDERSRALSFLDLEQSTVAALRAGDPQAAEASIRAMQGRLVKALRDAPHPAMVNLLEGERDRTTVAK